MKEIYMSLSERIATKVPQILWIDLDRGQSTGIEMPAALITLNYPQIESISDTEQQVELTVGVRLLFNNEYLAETAAVYPTQCRDLMLSWLDTVDAVAAALQGFGTPFMSPLSRRSQTSNLSGSVAGYTLQFTTTIFEYFY